MAKKNHELLNTKNLDQEDVEDNLRYLQKRYLGPGKFPAEKNQLSMRKTHLNFCLEVAIYKHLGFNIGKLKVSKYVSDGVKIALDYFFGDYLKKDPDLAGLFDKNPKNDAMSWFEVYRLGLLFALFAKDKKSEKKLVTWVDPSLPFDESSYLVSKQDNFYHMLLAEYLCAGQIENQSLVKEIAKCKKKSPKLLLACLTAISDDDSDGLNSAMKEYLGYFLKSEFAKSGIPTLFSIEASLLWEVAARAGFEITGLTDKQMAAVMTRESLGLA